MQLTFRHQPFYIEEVDMFERRLKKEVPKAQYQQLKGALWAFRKKKSALSLEEEDVLQRLFSYSPALKKAYAYREQLSAI
jgi:transposase